MRSKLNKNWNARTNLIKNIIRNSSDEYDMIRLETYTSPNKAIGVLSFGVLCALNIIFRIFTQIKKTIKTLYNLIAYLILSTGLGLM